MPDFEHQRIILETIQQLRKIDAFVVSVLERPGKLKQDRAQLSHSSQDIHSLAHLTLVFSGRLAALMREDPMKLGRKHEIARFGNATDPRFCSGDCERPVETAVDFNSA